MVKGIIFDADGTLLDSMPFWHGLMGEALRSLNVKPSKELNSEIEYMSPFQACEYVIDKFNIPITPEEMMNKMKMRIFNFYNSEVALKPGIKEFLEKLKGAGIKMTVATGTDSPLVSAGLKLNGILDYFEEVLSCADVGKRKNEPDIYRISLEHLGTEKVETIVFEDALYCLETAKADGFKVVAVNEKTERATEEMIAKSDFYMTDYNDFDGFMLKFN